MADEIAVVGGVDTHTDFHPAVIGSIGRHLATEAFPTTTDGYQRLLDWLRSHGDLMAVGVEGTGAYDSELARLLRANHVTVVDVDRPDRRAAAPTASPTPLTPTLPRPPSCPAAQPTHPKPATASSKPSAPCAWSCP
ncbi:transposase [Streptomyces sp. NPDC056638]|uniref:IS110 family transposase n=1 Tax=Streptomyces sp. NPDC056638 TaxID=3345887 RepID=UPI0036995124